MIIFDREKVKMQLKKFGVLLFDYINDLKYHKVYFDRFCMNSEAIYAAHDISCNSLV